MKTEFKLTAPEDDFTDPDITLVVDGAPSRVAIQDCRAYAGVYVVNLYAPADEEFWVQDCGSFASLSEAKQRALVVYRTRVI